MRLFVLSVFLCSLLLTACKTYKSVDFFGKDQLGDSWSSSAFSEYLQEFDEKPLNHHELKEGETLFRFLVLQAGDPVHLIKVRTDQDSGVATVSIKKTNFGYMRQGSKLTELNRLKPPKARVSKFLSEISKYEFWTQSDAPQYDYHSGMLSHPPMFLLEGKSLNKTVSFYDFEPVFRKNTPHLALAFYALVVLDANDDWTYAGYFSEWVKVDWTYED